MFLAEHGCDDDTVRVDILFAVNEACTNAVVHAYRDRGPGEFEVRAEPEDGDLLIRVRDYGSGMLLNPDSQGLGIGLSMMAALSKNMTIASANPGTEVCLRFALTASH